MKNILSSINLRKKDTHKKMARSLQLDFMLLMNGSTAQVLIMLLIKQRDIFKFNESHIQRVTAFVNST
jgi:hypothetical protein